jgi:small subunit ribosomal protein S13
MVILGIKIPLEKKISIALTTLYGIGLSTAMKICKDLSISPNCKTKDLSEKQKANIINQIRTYYIIEENLKKEVQLNIQKYVDNGSIRGFRHRHGLPVRGQRTHTNAKTQKKRKFKSITFHTE